MKKQTYESALSELEEIVAKLENGSLPLDEALKLFEKGNELSVFCAKCLQRAELSITTLSEKESGNEDES